MKRHSCTKRLEVLLAARAFSLFGVLIGATVMAWEPPNGKVKEGAEALELGSPQLNECSGIAFSRVAPNCLWSHNDSGDTPRMIAFDQSGELTGWLHLNHIKAIDWEDMDSYQDGGPRLLAADVGDNLAKRKNVTLYLFDEPDPNNGTPIDRFQTLTVEYERGPRNCESVAVDVANRRILLLSKSPIMAALFSVPLPPREDAPGGKLEHQYIAKRVAGPLAIPMATGMDLCPKTGDLWISSYLHGFRFKIAEDEQIEEALTGDFKLIEMPKLRQIEAIAITRQGQVWVGSEGVPARLQRIRIPKQ